MAMAIACTAIRPWPVLQAEPATCNTSHSALAALLPCKQRSPALLRRPMNPHRIATAIAARPRQRGLSLVELLVGLFLGLLIIGVAMGALMASRAVSATVSDAGQLQQQASHLFRVMGRQIRQAGSLRLLLASHKKATEAIDVADPLHSRRAHWTSTRARHHPGPRCTRALPIQARRGLQQHAAAAHRPSRPHCSAIAWGRPTATASS